MSDEPTQQPDDQTKLLTEIRDILIQQCKQNDEQWAKYDEQWSKYNDHWEAQLRDNRQTKFGCFTSAAALAIIAVLILIGQLLSN